MQTHAISTIDATRICSVQAKTKRQERNAIIIYQRLYTSIRHRLHTAISGSRVKTFPGKIKKYPQPCVTPRCRKTVLVPSREIRREICPGVPSLESNQANQERRSAPSSPPAGPPGIPETRELRTRILALLCIRARARAHLVPAPDRARETNTDLIVC